MKKVIAIILALAMMFCLAACGGSKEEKGTKIGILQFAPHASLDNCTKGIMDAFNEKGFVDGQNGCTIEFFNGQGEGETNQLAAQNFVNKGFDIIIAIATPSAMPCYAAAKDAGSPVIFSEVSDPV